MTAPAIVPPSTDPTSGTVLLVHAADASWLGTRLKGQGHITLQARTAEEALASITAEDPDLVVVDAALPAEGARAICAALGSGPDLDRPIVVESATPLTIEQRIAWLRLGVWDCFSPVGEAQDDESLLRIEWFLRARRATSRNRLGMLTDPATGLYNRLGLSRRAREMGAQSFRKHEPVGCVVFVLGTEPASEASIASCARAIHAEGRLSDVVARLADHEFAVLAPATDEVGTLRMAERVAATIRRFFVPTEGVEAQLTLRAAWDSVPSLGYSPVQPIDLVIRAAAALRAGLPGEGDTWLRRSGGHARVQELPH